MPPPTRIGKYRHKPGTEFSMGPDGRLRPSRTRRRFPFAGLVFVTYAVLGAAVCAGASFLLRVSGASAFLPQRLTGEPLPPSPTFNNLFFGAGLPEVTLACGVAGWWLWSFLWKTRLPAKEPPRGMAANGAALLSAALVMGPLVTFITACIGIMGLYLRTAPADQPWAVRPFFGLLAITALGSNALYTGIIPIILLLLGLILGGVTAFAVAYFWTQFPEEPAYK